MNSILHIITTINRGGAENHLFQLVTEQRRAGYAVTVIYLKGNGYWKEQLVHLGVRVVNLNLNHYYDFSSILELRKLLQTERYGIIHLHLQPAEWIYRLASVGLKKKGTKVFITKHNDEPTKNLPLFFQRLLFTWLAQPADRVIAISEHVRTYWTSMGLDQRKISVVYYGIPSSRYRNLNETEIRNTRNSLCQEPGQLLVGTVARLHPQKSLGTLIEAARLLNGKMQVQVAIVGDGPLLQELQDLIQRYGLERHVFLIGFRDDVPEIMNALDVFVLPSVYEGLGLVLLEAMAAGKAIIISNAGAMPEICGPAGLIFDVGNAQQLADHILHLGDKAAREALGFEGRRRVDEYFNVPTMMDRINLIYACAE